MSKLYWTVKIGIEKEIIEDGAELTKERMEDIMQSGFPFVYGHEISVKIIEKPNKKIIRKIQGYK